MRNFGFRELFIVNPKCPLGFGAHMYAKHGAEVLRRAKRARNIADAAKGCALVVGTTGIARRSKRVIRNPMSVAELKRKIKRVKGTVALLLGREGMGLTPDEIRQCDFLVTIEADGSYPVLNISHALAVLLYELRGAKGGTWEGLAPREERKALVDAFAGLARRGRPLSARGEKGPLSAKQKVGGKVRVRDPAKIATAFKNVVERGLVSSLEARAMLAALKEEEE